MTMKTDFKIGILEYCLKMKIQENILFIKIKANQLSIDYCNPGAHSRTYFVSVLFALSNTDRFTNMLFFVKLVFEIAVAQ